MKALQLVLTAAGLITLAGCAGRDVERVVVAGVVLETPQAEPADQLVLIQLPPLPADLVTPDTTDGTVLCEVNQRTFVRDFGRELPTYRVPKAIPDEKGDPLAPMIVSVRRDIQAIATLLDGVFDDATVGSAQGRRSERHAATLVLSDSEWRDVLKRLGALVERIDQVVQAIAGPPAYGDGSTQHQARTDRLWTGMAARTAAVSVAAEQLARDGFAAILTAEDATGTVRPQIDGIQATAQRLVSVSTTHDAPRVVPVLRLLQQQMDALEDTPAWIAGIAHQDGRSHPTTQPQRDETRMRVVALRKAIVAAAGQWVVNAAALIELQERPSIVTQIQQLP